MYVIEWLRDFEVLKRERSTVETASDAIANAKTSWSEVAACLDQEPDRFRVRDQSMKELAVVYLSKRR